MHSPFHLETLLKKVLEGNICSGEEGFTDMVEYLTGSNVPRVSVRCLAEWRDGRLVSDLNWLAIGN